MGTAAILAISCPAAVVLTGVILHRGLDKLAERGATVTVSLCSLTFKAAQPKPAPPDVKD